MNPKYWEILLLLALFGSFTIACIGIDTVVGWFERKPKVRFGINPMFMRDVK
jgi:hypothetical protein